MHKPISIRDRHDYAEFFVDEKEPVKRSDGSIEWAALWCCYSSFGVFGYYWSGMGEPFAEFIAGIDAGYLLGKIAKKEFDDDTCLKSVRGAIVEARRDRRRTVTKEIAREAWDAVESISEGYSGESLATVLYECGELSILEYEWTEMTNQAWDRQAVAFVERMWPKFVAAYASLDADRLISKCCPSEPAHRSKDDGKIRCSFCGRDQ